MPTLLMLRGLPASGKSTFAKALVQGDKAHTAIYGKNWKRVNKDDLRTMIDSGKWSKENEKQVLGIRDDIIGFYLARDNNVVVDDTNLAPKHEERLSHLARNLGAEFKVKDFTDVSVEECIKRDQNRSNYAGEKVIKGMYNSFLKPKAHVAKYTMPAYDPDLPTCIIVDIDGTLAHMDDRSPYDYTKVETDLVDQVVAGIVRKYAQGDVGDVPNCYIVIVSGREDGSMQVTKDWLADNMIPYHEIYMRKNGDFRDDTIIKTEIYEQFIKPRFNVKFVLDDRDKVVKQWRDLGLKCLQVAPGDF